MQLNVRGVIIQCFLRCLFRGYVGTYLIFSKDVIPFLVYSTVTVSVKLSTKPEQYVIHLFLGQ